MRKNPTVMSRMLTPRIQLTFPLEKKRNNFWLMRRSPVAQKVRLTNQGSPYSACMLVCVQWRLRIIITCILRHSLSTTTSIVKMLFRVCVKITYSFNNSTPFRKNPIHSKQ
uniref:Uncharacterized protein n=1 Tax=Cacopsylla melanoneura TaxID=428564 RepID=A0A8D8TJ01_9HEMI